MPAKGFRTRQCEDVVAQPGYKWLLLSLLVWVALFGWIAKEAAALEIITEEDVKKEIVTTVHLVKTADNAIILFDSSRSMAKALKGSDTPRLEALREMLATRLGWLPDLGYNLGLYLYTPWTELYPVQPFDKARFAEAIQQLPKEASGDTLLIKALQRLDPILEGLSGRTVVFLFSDGQYTRYRELKRPAGVARQLAQKYNVCFYVLSTAATKQHEKTLQDIADVNECSRLIEFSDYMNRPSYNSGALFVVKANTELVTVTEEKVVGVRGQNILFGFDTESILPEYQEQLNKVGAFMQANPNSYVVMHGYADNTGSSEYNMKLSHKRAEAVADYLADKFGIESKRMVVMWFGSLNPAASNDTEEGRKLNRRVEIAVGIE
jgi:OOP family OmpA-OmpF porin